MRLALYCPDIPHNVGAALRLGACLGVGVDIIGPTGFPFDDARVRRVGMDYIHLAEYAYHPSWDAFKEARPSARLVLLTTKASAPHVTFRFHEEDILLCGRESSGAPEDIHRQAAARIRIPMQEGARSLNLAVSAGIVLGEALRQINGFPPD